MRRANLPPNLPNDLPDPAPDPVPLKGLPDPTGGDNSEPALRGGRRTENEEPTDPAVLCFFDSTKVSPGSQPRFAGKFHCSSRIHPEVRSLLRIVLNGVALVVDLGTFRDEALPTLGATLPDDGPTCLRLHASTKAMLALAAPF